MAGSKEGAKKAVETKLQRYGKNVFAKNGALGGKARNASAMRYTPFSDAEFASAQGKKGSRKRWSKEQ